MKAMLEPRMVAAMIQAPFRGEGSTHGFARIRASSQGGLAILAIIHSRRTCALKAFGVARWLISFDNVPLAALPQNLIRHMGRPVRTSNSDRFVGASRDPAVTCRQRSVASVHRSWRNR